RRRAARRHCQTSRVRILISEVSVRWTGHRSAISRNRLRWSSDSVPIREISRSMTSSIPCFVSQSAQSSACTRECRRRTATSPSGQRFLRAYSAMVIDVHAPRPARRRSYGPGPVSVPPSATGSSATRRWRPARISCANPAALPRTGKVLSWGKFGDAQVWDPATGVFTAVPAPSRVFCAGHDFLPDGRLLVAGGHISDLHGLPNTNVFDPATNTWQALPPMAAGRWYPTNTTLPDGEVVTIGGTDTAGADVTIPEVWNGTAWRQLTTAALALPLYPRAFVAPDGRIFYAGELQQSLYLDVSGTGQWTAGPMRQFGRRDYGSAVMYEPGKVLYAGGGDPPTNTAEIIDLNQPNPAWQYTGSMAFARRQMNATLLPTGDVLVTGGTTSGGFNNPEGAVHSAELWSPAT